MKLRILSGREVHDVLTYPECADAMRTALVARANGEFFQPLRTVLKPPRAAGLVALMPVYGDGQSVGYGLKAITITPGNTARDLDTHQGIVLLSSSDTGLPVAVLNASVLTEIRTAAVSAVATSLLANEDADVLAIIGTGVQAERIFALSAAPGNSPRSGSRAVPKARPRRSAAEAPFADEARLVACASVEQALAGPASSSPRRTRRRRFCERERPSPGTHINAVGAGLPDCRELDTATVASAALYGDSRESMIAEAGDYVLAAAEGATGSAAASRPSN